MRRSRSALLSLSKLSSSNLPTTNLLMLISCILICTALSFAAAPDRITGAIVSSQTVALAKSLHPKAQPQYDLGPVDPSRQLSYITLLMAPSASQQKALNRLLAQQQDPKSPNYHKWLTPQQYADRFGLSQNDLSKIITWLRSQGFQILSIGGGRNSIVFSGTAAEVQHAFATEIHNYTVNGENHFANSTPLMIPSALNGIVTTVIGLHDFRAQPANRGKSFGGMRSARRDYYDGNYLFPNFLAPDDIATIYDIAPLYTASTPINGTGQKLAIVGQTDIYLADINDFRAGFNLSQIPTTGAGACTTNSNGIVISPCTTTNFAYVLLGTDPGAPSPGDLSESDLDIEWSGAVARNAQIVFVNAETSGGVYDALTAVINPPIGPPLAPVVSMSYGICEAQALDLETLLQQGNAEGVTIVNSAGDDGAAGCDYTPPNASQPFSPAVLGLAVSYPASSPEVTGVGGTVISLANDSFPNPSPYWSTTLGTNGGTAVSYIPELAWNDDEELAQWCQADSSELFCSQGGSPAVSGWVPLTSTATAAQVQSDIWISIAGGGASNCFTETVGGVCQAGFPQPTWQQGLSVPSAPAGVRYVPDVSLLASPNFPGYILCTPLSEFGGVGSTSTCAGGIFTAVDTYGSIIGGTSASAPVFAGILTLLNQYLVQNSFQANPGLGNANPNLYHIATYNQAAFHQLTTGDNMVYCKPGTPTIQPTALQCPAAVPPAAAGVFGYQASNAVSATGYNLVNGLGSVDANNLTTAWGELLTASTTSLSPSAANIIQGQSETLTITVTPSSASGIVTLFNNGSTTALGTATVSGGTGTFVTTALPVGTNSIAGTYNGTDASSTSAAVTVTVAAPTFTWTTSSTSHTVLAGQKTLAYTFTATPTSSSTFASAVTFACAFAPTDTTLTPSSCAFTPTTIPAGTAGATPVSMTITTVGPNNTGNGSLRHRAANRSPWLPLTLPIAGVVMLGLVGRKVSKRSAIALLCFSLVVLGFMMACGGSSSSPVSVSVSPATVSLWPNDTADNWPSSSQAFTATVGNTTNTAVTWSISPSTGAGSIDASGNYTAPTIAAGLPASATVTATSQADSTKTGTSTITLKSATVPGTFTVTVTAAESGATSQTQGVSLVVQ
ncbi:MAG: protease pro-enzyme activation domain-containing protein [Terriglobales bacterium]